jgi:hypothetical protein
MVVGNDVVGAARCDIQEARAGLPLQKMIDASRCVGITPSLKAVPELFHVGNDIGMKGLAYHADIVPDRRGLAKTGKAGYAHQYTNKKYAAVYHHTNRIHGFGGFFNSTVHLIYEGMLP